MTTKLTLKMNTEIIKKAKALAAQKHISLSGLVENYLESLTNQNSDELDISPFVRSISSGKSVPVSMADQDLKETYLNYLEAKHQ
jgi:hypothetical protein